MSARWSAMLAALVLAACAAPGPTPTPGADTIVLENADFEAAVRPGESCALGWGCSAHSDTTAFHFLHEKGGYCIEGLGLQPWAKVTQAVGMQKVMPLRGKRVRLSMNMRLDAVEPGTAGPAIIVQGGSGQIVKYLANLKGRMEGVQRVDAEIVVPPDAFLLEVGVVFEGPKGTKASGKACFDDVLLESMAPAAGPV